MASSRDEVKQPRSQVLEPQQVDDLFNNSGVARVGRPRRAQTKAEAAYDEIRARILDGSLPPGAAIDQESLASALGSSTTPIREAVQWLAAEHLVITRAHREMLIAPLSGIELAQIYEVRLRLDPWAAALSALSATEADRARVNAAAARLGADSAAERLRANHELHQSILEACGNPELVRVLGSLADRARRYRVVTLRSLKDHQIAYDEHREIIDAFLERDAELSSKLMFEHLLESFHRISSYLPAEEMLGLRLEVRDFWNPPVGLTGGE